MAKVYIRNGKTFFQSQVMVSKKHEVETHLEDDWRKKKRDYTQTLAMKKETSSDSLADRKPSHSVVESLSSFASLEDLNTTEEKKMYVNDSQMMLSLLRRACAKKNTCSWT